MPETNLPRFATLKKIHPGIPLTIGILALLYIGLNIWIFFYGTEVFRFLPFLKTSIESISITKMLGFGAIPRPTPNLQRTNYTLPTGRQEWTFTLGPGITGPKIQTAAVDPLTPQKGQQQTVTITAKHTAPISAKATLFTDHTRKSATMKLTAGSNTNGTWAVTWTVDDTYENIYHIDFELTSTKGSWTGALTFK